MKAKCPHCHRDIDVRVSLCAVDEAQASTVVTPQMKKPKGQCACGHERAMHDDGGHGACHYGRGHALGGCSCDRFHSRAHRTHPPTVNGMAKPSSEQLTPCARALLTVLLQRGSANRKQLAVMSGYSVTSGGFAQALAQLRNAGLLDGGASGFVPVLPQAERALGHVEPLPRGPALLEYWSERVGPCASAILERVVTEYPKSVDRTELASTTGYSASSGGFASALAQLRTLALLDGFRASDALMSAVRSDQ